MTGKIGLAFVLYVMLKYAVIISFGLIWVLIRFKSEKNKKAPKIRIRSKNELPRKFKGIMWCAQEP